jgi:hypothetical protein
LRCGPERVRRRERQRLEVRLKREVQFNRKVEINAALRQCQTELADLEGTGDLSLDDRRSGNLGA